MRPRTRQLALIASLLATGSVSVDATIYDGEDLAPRQILMQARAERIDVRQTGDVVEASLPWVDQPGIKVKYNLGSTTAMERLLDRRKQEALIDNTSFGEGGVKFDILLNEKPDTNKFCYTVEGAENYQFIFQGALTPQEISQGSVRPPNIVGSYAVYHRALKNNQYKTGKAFHIERPQVWSLSNEGVKQYATLSYTDGDMCVTAPQSFLDTADYPVRIDPTFGYTSAGATKSDPCASSDCRIGVFLPVTKEMSDIESMHWYATSTVAGRDSAMAIYTASTTSFTAYTVATSTQATTTGAATWYQYNIEGTFSVATGTWWLVWITDSGAISFRDSGMQSSNAWGSGVTWSYPLSTITSNQTLGSANSLWSGYITYQSSYSCDGTTTTCGEKLVLTTSRSTDHGIAGSKMTTLSSTTAYVLWEASKPTAATGLAAISKTISAFDMIEYTTVPDTTNDADTVAYALWDGGWTLASTSNYLHISTLDLGVDDTYYTQHKMSVGTTSSTVLGTTQGATASVGANYSAITMAENGDLFMASADVSDSWVVACNGTSTCTTASNWYEKGPASTAGAFRDKGDDVPFLSPIGGTNNVMLMYWDTSADQLTYNIWSATSSSWFTATTTIATGIDDNTTYEGQMISMAYASTTGTTYLAVVDDANDYTTADHDIRVWSFSSTTGWTALTNATTTASGGLQGVNISIDPCTGQLFVAYVRRTTIGTATTANIYWATSTDNGSTWSTEKGPITTAQNYTNFGGSPVSCNQQYVTYKRVSTDSIYVNAFYNPYTAPAGGDAVIYQSEFFMQ